MKKHVVLSVTCKPYRGRTTPREGVVAVTFVRRSRIWGMMMVMMQISTPLFAEMSFVFCVFLEIYVVVKEFI